VSPAATAAPRHARNVIEVFPGRHALAKALAQAQPGDTISIHHGTYRDNVAIGTSDLMIVAAGDGKVTIDGRCRAEEVIAVRADNVSIQNVTVVGGEFYEIDYRFRAGYALVSGTTVLDTCGSAEYGINLFDVGPMAVKHNVGSGFGDSGIYVGGIVDTGGDTLTIARNEVFGSSRGIIVEDSANVSIDVGYNNLHDNQVSGLHLTNSDGILIQYNQASNDGTYGIDLDADSDNNIVRRNTATGNTFDLGNLGGLPSTSGTRTPASAS
jgi:parallel beta-helix repeat protein